MSTLKNLGRLYNAATRSKSREQSRPLTNEEQKQLILALSTIVDVSDIAIEYVDESPYESEHDLRLDLAVNKRFRTPVLSCPGMMSDEVYTLYRFMHDFRNHYLQNKSFSPFDELLSALDLINALEGKVSDYTLDFIFTDVLLMNSVYEFSPSKWGKLENGKHHYVCCRHTWRSSGLLVPSKG